jgi:hypothetical protein
LKPKSNKFGVTQIEAEVKEMRGYTNKKGRDRHVISKLEVLTRFLNLNFATASREEIEALNNDLSWWVGVRVKCPTERKARLIQGEMRGYILPIIAPEGKVEIREAVRRLTRLLSRIARMQWSVLWDANPLDHQREVRQNSITGKREVHFQPLTPDVVKRRIKMQEAAGDNVLSVLGHKWVIKEVWRKKRNDPFGDSVYTILILHALRTGALSDLKKCKHCPKLYVQRDPRKEFCSTICKNEFHNRRRAGKNYFSQRRKELRVQKLNDARRLFNKGEDVSEIVQATGLSWGMLRRAGIS